MTRVICNLCELLETIHGAAAHKTDILVKELAGSGFMYRSEKD
jgi:hypothetical protein